MRTIGIDLHIVCVESHCIVYLMVSRVELYLGYIT